MESGGEREKSTRPGPPHPAKDDGDTERQDGICGPRSHKMLPRLRRAGKVGDHSDDRHACGLVINARGREALKSSAAWQAPSALNPGATERSFEPTRARLIGSPRPGSSGP